MGHVGSETWSLSQILEKSCVLSGRHIFDPICMKLGQNAYHHEISYKFVTASCQVKKWSIDQILEKPFLHNKGVLKVYSNLF